MHTIPDQTMQLYDVALQCTTTLQDIALRYIALQYILFHTIRKPIIQYQKGGSYGFLESGYPHNVKNGCFNTKSWSRLMSWMKYNYLHDFRNPHTVHIQIINISTMISVIQTYMLYINISCACMYCVFIS